MNYKKQLIRCDIDKINKLAALLLLPSFIVPAIINILVLKRPFILTSSVYFDVLIMLGILIVGMLVHEGIHALGAMIFAKKKPNEIRFGAHWKQMMLFCHIKTPMKKNACMGLVILPIILTGIIPLIISTFFGNFFLIVAFTALVSGGAGDLIMFKKLARCDKNALILDHDSAPAYYLLYPENETPDDFVEVTEEEETALKEEMTKRPKLKGSTMLLIVAIAVFLCITAFVLTIVALLMKLF